MKRLFLFATSLALIAGCSKNNSATSSDDTRPLFQYTAKWSLTSESSQPGGSVTIDTFSSGIQVSDNFNIYREIYTDENNKIDYYLAGSDTTTTLINTLQFYLKSLKVQAYHIDSASLATHSGDFEYVAAYIDVIGKDMYGAQIKDKNDYFDLNVTSITPDSLASGNFSCSMTSERVIGSNTPDIITPGGYVIKNGVFKNIPVKTLYTEKNTTLIHPLPKGGL